MIGVARRLGRTLAGQVVAERAYGAAARLAAEVLVRVPGVVSVYLGGSLAQDGQARAGYSDIDVVPFVDVPTLDAELRLQEGLVRAMRLLNAGGLLFKNIDYMEVRDADLFRTEGDVWSLDWDRRWVYLAGRDVRPPPGTVAAPDAHRRMERLARIVRRWAKASSFILDQGAGRELHLVRIGAERLLGDALAALLDRDRFVPLALMLHDAASRVTTSGALSLLARSMSSAGGLPPTFQNQTLIAGALEALELAIGEATASWQRRTVRGERANVDGVALAAGRRLLDEGYESVLVGERSPSDRVLFVLERAGVPPEAALERLTRVLGTVGPLPRDVFPWAHRPVLLTDGLLRGAFLFEPRLDEGAAHLLGAPLPPLPQVPEAVWERYARASRLATIVRARCRRLRAHRSPAAALAALARDVERLDRSAGHSRATPVPQTHRALLGAVRDHLAALRHST